MSEIIVFIICILIAACLFLSGVKVGLDIASRHIGNRPTRSGIGTCLGCGSSLLVRVSTDPEWWQCSTVGCGLAGQGEKKPDWVKP